MSFGETVSITCTVSGGDLPMNIEWTLNGRPLRSILEVLTVKHGKRIVNLMIDSVSAKHAGNYSCVARNLAGVAEHSARLIVNGLW